MKLERAEFGGVKAYYRPGSSDPNTLKEVLEGHVYGRAKIEAGESWLDLGANVGAFALDCLRCQASVECYEPDPDCFFVLGKNVPQAKLVNAAVTALKASKLQLYAFPRQAAQSRNTVFARHGYKAASEIINIWAGKLQRRKFDGVKLDIEGSEGPLIDEGLLPQCSKLCMEYHTSVDDDLSHFFSRIEKLKQKFSRVEYPAEFDRALAKGLKHFKPFFDRMVFAWQ